MSFDISQELSENTNMSTEMFAKLLTLLQRNTPKINDEIPPDWLVQSPHIDLHTQTIIIGDADVDKSEALKSVSPFGYVRRVPTNVRAYILTHDDSNATGISFPNAMTEALVMGAGGKTDGASYQIINDDSWFDVTQLVIAMNLKLPATAGGDAIQTIIEKLGTFGIQIDAHATAPNQLRCGVKVATVAKEVTFSYTADTWFTLIFHVNSTNLTVWKDNVQVGQIATGAAIDTNANNVGIWGTATGTQKMKLNGRIAWLTLGDKNVDSISAWRTAYHTDKIIDWETAASEEITTFPYLSKVDAEPNSHAGFFWW